MPITRSTFLSGPAAATFNGHTYFARDGILVTPILDLDAVGSDAWGWLDSTATAQPVSIRFTPSAPFADLIALYPYLEGAPGTSLFGAADTPLVITAVNGARLTFSSVAITEMPDLHLSTRGPVNGPVTFVAIGSRDTALDATNRLVTFDNATIPLAVPGTPQLADHFVVAWGGTPWANLYAQDGIRVRFALGTRAVLSDANALLDLTLEKLGVEVRLVPVGAGGPAESDLVSALQFQGGESLPGRLLSSTAAPLVIGGEHLFLALPLAQLTGGSLAFDAVHDRMGELVFTAPRAFLEAGSSAPLATLTEGTP